MEFVTFNNGVKMPILGFGTYQIEPKDTQKCVEDAISVGYRSIDTAQAYFNEEGVGVAVKNAINGGIKREELFITTKLWINNTQEQKALKSIETSLKKLQVDYLDLLLIHQPFGDIYGAWRTMSKLYKEGIIKAIGVSNFYPDRLIDFCLNNEVIPAINQIECHPYFARVDYQKFMADLGIITQSWASFAEGKNDIFKNQTLAKIGTQYGKTPAQVILRWLIQRGVVVIPKTISKERMIENISVFDFTLLESDIAQIATLDTRKSLFIDHSDPEIIKWLIEVYKDRF